jgi:site-specific recombinase XerD
VHLDDLLGSWLISLRGEGRSRNTLKAYSDGVRRFLRWCEETGTEPRLNKATVNAFVAALLDGGAEPATASNRQLALRRFSAWLAAEDEIDRDELLGLRAVKIDTKVTPRLTDDQLVLLLKACAGREFNDRRDTAIVRLLIETGARIGEVLAMKVTDLDVAAGRAVLTKGKGGIGRAIPIGPHACAAMDRYLRARSRHRFAELPELWISRVGPFRYFGVYEMLVRRAEAAGIANFHPHLLRHTAAQRWLSAGGSEGGLMAMAGWKRREMLDRYTRASASERAAEEASRLNLGNL